MKETKGNKKKNEMQGEKKVKIEEKFLMELLSLRLICHDLSQQFYLSVTMYVRYDMFNGLAGRSLHNFKEIFLLVLKRIFSLFG